MTPKQYLLALPFGTKNMRATLARSMQGIEREVL